MSAEKENRLYNLVEERKPVRKNKNPLDEAIEEEDIELAREAKRLRLQQAVTERRKRLQELEGEGASSATTPSVAASLASILGIYGGDQQKVDEVLTNLSPEAMRNLILLTSASSGNPNMLLPIAMMTRAEAKPTEIADTVAKYVELMQGSKGVGTTSETVEIVDKVINAVKPSQGEGYVKPLVDELKEARKQIQEQRFREIEKKIEETKQPHPREFFEEFQKDAETFGFAPKAAGKVGEMDLKLEEMRESHELKLAEINLNLQKWMYEREMEREKWDVARDLISPVVAVAGKPIEEGLRQLGRGGAPPPKTAVMNVPVECTCGFKQFIQFPVGAMPEKIKCPQCGGLLGREVEEKTWEAQGEQPSEKPKRKSGKP